MSHCLLDSTTWVSIRLLQFKMSTLQIPIFPWTTELSVSVVRVLLSRCLSLSFSHDFQFVPCGCSLKTREHFYLRVLAMSARSLWIPLVLYSCDSAPLSFWSCSSFVFSMKPALTTLFWNAVHSIHDPLYHLAFYSSSNHLLPSNIMNNLLTSCIFISCFLFYLPG